MLLNLLPDLVTAAGDLLIGYSVITVHRKMSQEKKIDSEVIEEIKEEGAHVYIGMGLIVAGFILRLFWNLKL